MFKDMNNEYVDYSLFYVLTCKNIAEGMTKKPVKISPYVCST